MGLKIISWNASDLRNKANVKKMLSDLVDSKVFINRFRVSKEYLILMDEVDGMTGSDRGGLQALVECLKETKIPIVCICNDRESRKLMTLLSHSYHIQFQRPEPSQVAKRLFAVCREEGLKMFQIEDLEQIATVFDCDVRQCLNFLHMSSKNKTSHKTDFFSKD